MSKIMILIFIGLLMHAASSVAESADYCPGSAPVNYQYSHDLMSEPSNWYHYTQGMKMVEARQWEQATKEFNYYLTQPLMHRRYWGISYYGFGVMYQKLGNIENALACYQLAIREDLHPETSVADKAYQNIGAIFIKQKKYAKSIENYKKAVEKDPNNGISHYYLGLAYLRNGDRENAEKESKEAKRLGVTFTALYDELAGKKVSEVGLEDAHETKDNKPTKKRKVK